MFCESVTTDHSEALLPNPRHFFSQVNHHSSTKTNMANIFVLHFSDKICSLNHSDIQGKSRYKMEDVKVRKVNLKHLQAFFNIK